MEVVAVQGVGEGAVQYKAVVGCMLGVVAVLVIVEEVVEFDYYNEFVVALVHHTVVQVGEGVILPNFVGEELEFVP